MKCEYCNKEHDGTYGSGRFCSKECARGFSSRDKREEINRKVSEKLTKNKHICTNCGKQIRKNKTYLCQSCYNKSHIIHEIMSKATKGKSGGFRKGGGYGKNGWYKGIWCDSSWELVFVIYNLENKIKFKRNNIGFEYIYNNEKHKYYPDFILEDGSYVEIKGYKTNQFNEKQKQFKGKLIIIDKEKIKPYIKYIEEKYGKDFIKLYAGLV